MKWKIKAVLSVILVMTGILLFIYSYIMLTYWCEIPKYVDPWTNTNLILLSGFMIIKYILLILLSVIIILMGIIIAETIL